MSSLFASNGTVERAANHELQGEIQLRGGPRYHAEKSNGRSGDGAADQHVFELGLDDIAGEHGGTPLKVFRHVKGGAASAQL